MSNRFAMARRYLEKTDQLEAWEVRESDTIQGVKICSHILENEIWLILDHSFIPIDGLACYYTEEIPQGLGGTERVSQDQAGFSWMQGDSGRGRGVQTLNDPNNSPAAALAAIIKPIVLDAVREAINLNLRGAKEVGETISHGQAGC